MKGSITEFESKSAGNSSGFGFGPVSLGNKHEEAHVGLIIQLVDTVPVWCWTTAPSRAKLPREARVSV